MNVIELEDFFLTALIAVFLLFCLVVILLKLKVVVSNLKVMRRRYYCNVCVVTFVDDEEQKFATCPHCDRMVSRDHQY